MRVLLVTYSPLKTDKFVPSFKNTGEQMIPSSNNDRTVSTPLKEHIIIRPEGDKGVFKLNCLV